MHTCSETTALAARLGACPTRRWLGVLLVVGPWLFFSVVLAGLPGVATGAGARTVVGLHIQPEAPRLPRGLTDKLYARVDYADGTVEYHYSVTGWSVATADGHPVAAVDDSGRVTALAKGRATLTLSYLGRTAETTLTVFDEPPSALTLSGSYYTLDLGTRLQFHATARFGADMKWWDVEKIVRWRAVDLGHEKQVLDVQPDGKVGAMGVGMAELTVELAGRRAARPVMVVEPLPDSPQRFEGRRVAPPDLYRLCMRRMRRVWVPRLRGMTDAPVKLDGESKRREASIDVSVRGAERGILIFWNPDECDATGPTSGWTPTGFDWRSPKTPLEQMLIFAGDDCMSYNVN